MTGCVITGHIDGEKAIRSVVDERACVACDVVGGSLWRLVGGGRGMCACLCVGTCARLDVDGAVLPRRLAAELGHEADRLEGIVPDADAARLARGVC